jgi:hypothetical protein
VIASAVLRLTEFIIDSHNVMAGHSRPKDGVASLAYVPAIHVFGSTQQKARRGCPAQGRA